MLRECTKCLASLPVDDFYKHPLGPYGRMSACKECHRAAVKKNRDAKIEKYREFDRLRAWKPERVAIRKARAARAKADPVLRKKDQAQRDAWAVRNAHKRQAHILVNRAVRAGALKVTPCVRCGYGVGLHAHHEDYSKPLEVMWLCKPCHGQRHREINAERRKQRAA